jgi:hypothetical protein
MEEIEQIRLEFEDIKQVLDERRIRWWCASKARAYNRIHKQGGVSIVSKATGISRSRIYQGITEIEQGSSLDKSRNRKEGGGRKKN